MNMTSFSNNILYIFRLMTLLLQVLKLEKNQSIDYVDEAMDRAKEAISGALKIDESKSR